MRTHPPRTGAEPPSPGGAAQRVNSWLEQLAQVAARWSSSSFGFASAVIVVLGWLATGPPLHYSQTWQLVINTGTTIVTFLMVFLVQRSQRKDALAIQLKLDEIVAAIVGASNALIAVEELPEEDLDTLHRQNQAVSEKARRQHVMPRAPSGPAPDRNEGQDEQTGLDSLERDRSRR